MNLHWHINQTTLLFFLSGAITMVLAWINWRQRRQPGLAKQAVIMLLISLWSLVCMLEASVRELDAKVTFVMMENFLVSLFITMLLPFFKEYLDWTWLMRRWLWLIWGVTIFFMLVELTNPFHRLFWVGYALDTTNPNLLVFSHGPLFFWDTNYFLFLLLACIGLLLFSMLRSRGWQRLKTGMLAASLAVPYTTYFFYIFDVTDVFGINFMPIGYTISALLITWVIFEDLLRSNRENLAQLQITVQALEVEVENRKFLEQNLLQSQASLSDRLTERTSQLAGLYDVVLFSEKSPPIDHLLQFSLDRIQVILGCDAACFITSTAGLRMSCWPGASTERKISLQDLRLDWVTLGHVVMPLPGDLPEEVRQMGFSSCVGKLVSARDQQLGVFACFWEREISLKADETALINALADELGVILHNAVQREIISLNAVQHERRRLARDLHDSVTQSLHSLVLMSETANVDVQNSERIKRILKLLETSARQALKEMRLMLFELRLTSLDEVNLLPSINNRLDAVEHRAGIRTEVQVEEGLSWDRDADIELYPILMEALNNSLKHARAAHVSLRFSRAGSGMLVEIEDNGIGFDPAAISPGGMGLKNMAERCERLGASLELLASPDHGTHIRITVPERNKNVIPSPD